MCHIFLAFIMIYTESCGFLSSHIRFHGFFIDNFCVYMLDSFLWSKNPDVNVVMKYIAFMRKVYVKSTIL